MLKIPSSYKGPELSGDRLALLDELSKLGFEVLPPRSKSNGDQTGTLVVYFKGEKVAYLNAHIERAGLLGCEFLKDGERTGRLAPVEVHGFVRRYLERNGGEEFDLRIVPGQGSNKTHRYVAFTTRAAAKKMLVNEVGLTGIGNLEG